MPPLEPDLIVPPMVPGTPGVNGGVAGFPLRLERLSPREEAHEPRRFGIETPYTATPTGWGEWIPVLPGEQIEGPVVVLAPATGLVP